MGCGIQPRSSSAKNKRNQHGILERQKHCLLRASAVIMITTANITDGVSINTPVKYERGCNESINYIVTGSRVLLLRRQTAVRWDLGAQAHLTDNRVANGGRWVKVILGIALCNRRTSSQNSRHVTPRHCHVTVTACHGCFTIPCSLCQFLFDISYD